MLTSANTQHTTHAQGLKINYHTAGTGPDTLVLLHGGGPGASSWGNFKHNMEALSKKFRVFAIDLPHWGQSDKPLKGMMDCHWYAQVLDEVLKNLVVEKAHFLGNSMGGTVALEYALAHPEKVDRLVLMGTAGSMPMFGPVPTEGARHIMNYYQGEGPTREKLEAFIRVMIYDQSRITPEFLEERYQASLDPELLVHREMNLERMFNTWRQVHEVKQKTLLIYGRDDRVVPWDTALLLMRLMPNADLHVFARSGHWSMWERTPEFNTVVENFLLGEAS